MKRMSPMTEEEREYAHNHIGVLYSFLKEHNFSYEEYFDIVSFGFMEAAQDYVRLNGTEKTYGFYNFAAHTMMEHVMSYWDKENRSNRMLERQAINIDQKIGESDDTVGDRIRMDEPRLEDQVVRRDIIDRTLSAANDHIARAIIMTACGYSLLETADRLQMSYGALAEQMSRFRHRIREQESYVMQNPSLCREGRLQEIQRNSKRKCRYGDPEKRRALDKEYNSSHRAQRSAAARKREERRKREREESCIMRWEGYL